LAGKMNVRAMTLSVALGFLYFIFTIGTLMAITFGIGYAAWDSTLIHSPNAFVRYLGISLGPAFFFSMLHLRIIEMITIDPTSIFVKVSLPRSLHICSYLILTLFPALSPTSTLQSQLSHPSIFQRMKARIVICLRLLCKLPPSFVSFAFLLTPSQVPATSPASTSTSLFCQIVKYASA
jgi:hypothetical protein